MLCLQCRKTEQDQANGLDMTCREAFLNCSFVQGVAPWLPIVFNNRLAAETDGLHHVIEGIPDLIEALAWRDEYHVKEPFRSCDGQQHIPFSTAEGRRANQIGNGAG